VLKVSAGGDWFFEPSENKAIDDPEFMPELEVQAGDFLATRANADPNSVGRTCIVLEPRPGLMLSDKTWRLVFDAKNKYSEFGILAWSKSPIFRMHIGPQTA
jgi:type I restriction enzyme S subunit